VEWAGIRHRAAVLVALIALAAGCAGAPPVAHTSLERGLEPLAAAFNAHVGRVRIVMLVAPT
jgi:hypothetical protein